MNRSDAAPIRQQAAKAFAQHIMVEEPVRSFRFHTHYTDLKAEQLWKGSYPFASLAIREKASFAYTSTYAFTLTWTPGHITLVGDLGELTLVHYSALRRFTDIGWALSSDHHYLMSKTDRREEYSAETTLRDVVQMLNEEPLRALNGNHGWRGNRIPGYRQELQAYRVEKAWNDRMFDDVALLAETFGGEPPEWADFDMEPPYDHPNQIERRPDWQHEYRISRSNTSLDRLWDIPDCWRPWVRVWRAFDGAFYNPETSDDNPTAVLKAGVRRRLKEELADTFAEGAESAANLLHKIGFDDFYGSYVWPARTYWQIAAIQHGVRMILADQQPAAAPLAEAA